MYGGLRHDREGLPVPSTIKKSMLSWRRCMVDYVMIEKVCQYLVSWEDYVYGNLKGKYILMNLKTYKNDRGIKT